MSALVVLPLRAFDDDRLGRKLLALLAHLSAYADRSGTVRIKQSETSHQFHIRRESLNRQLRQLIAFGYVSGTRSNRNVEYKLLFDAQSDVVDFSRKIATDVTPCTSHQKTPDVTQAASHLGASGNGAKSLKDSRARARLLTSSKNQKKERVLVNGGVEQARRDATIDITSEFILTSPPTGGSRARMASGYIATIAEKDREWARHHCAAVNLEAATDRFEDYWQGRYDRDSSKTSQGWKGAWRNWLRKDQEAFNGRAAASKARGVNGYHLESDDERRARIVNAAMANARGEAPF